MYLLFNYEFRRFLFWILLSWWLVRKNELLWLYFACFAYLKPYNKQLSPHLANRRNYKFSKVFQSVRKADDFFKRITPWFVKSEFSKVYNFSSKCFRMRRSSKIILTFALSLATYILSEDNHLCKNVRNTNLKPMFRGVTNSERNAILDHLKQTFCQSFRLHRFDNALQTEIFDTIDCTPTSRSNIFHTKRFSDSRKKWDWYREKRDSSHDKWDVSGEKQDERW